MGKQTARAIIFNSQGQLLMIERHKDGEHYFVLPGGHIEKDEMPETAAIREVAEETGLEVTIDRLLYTSTDDKYGNDQRIYLCTYHGGVPQLQPDSQEYQIQQSGAPEAWLPAWFTFDELRHKTIYPLGLLHYIEEDRALNFRRNPYKIIERRV
jgi:8-oxo-dGTP diphosphatase